MKIISIVFFLMITVATLFGSIDYNIDYESDGMGYDEVNNKYRIKLQVKSNDGDFPIGFFNLRVLYNNQCLLFNNSESYSTGPIEDWIFSDLIDVYRLIPVEMSSIKCGFDGIYNGPNTNSAMCYILDNTWTDCGILVFDVINANESTNIRWDQSGVQNQFCLYDYTPIENGTFYGDHDIFLMGKKFATEGDLVLSEVVVVDESSNWSKSYIELRSLSDERIYLDNISLSFSNGSDYQLSGFLDPFKHLVCSFGADQSSFESYWGIIFYQNSVHYTSMDSLHNGSVHSIELVEDNLTVIDDVDFASYSRAVKVQPDLWAFSDQTNLADPGFGSQFQSLFVKYREMSIEESNINNTICWVVSEETNVVGYRLFRGYTEDLAQVVPLNQNQLIDVSSGDFPRDYSYNDNDFAIGQTCYYWIEVILSNNESGGFRKVTNFVLSTDEAPEYEETYLANYPNPFNPETTIEFSIKGKNNKIVDTKLSIYNIKGQKVIALINDKLNTGETYSVVWDGKDKTGSRVSSGVYFYKLETNDFVKTKKMILMK